MEIQKMRSILIGAAICAIGFPASAAVVTSIRINNAVPDWLQISEVIATQAGTGNDVALSSAGATVMASSTGYGTVADTAIDGVGPAPYPAIYHSGGNDGTDFLVVTFAQAYELSSLTIDGREDSYGSRDYYAYQLYNGTDLVGSGNIDARNDAHSGTATLDAAAAVPEPASWAMFIGGFGMIGGAIRRRSAVVSFA